MASGERIKWGTLVRAGSRDFRHRSWLASFEFEPTEDDWRRIETAYPFLSPADRDEISRMATDYLMRAPFESRAPKRSTP
jgi:hypothetical protein